MKKTALILFLMLRVFWVSAGKEESGILLSVIDGNFLMVRTDDGKIATHIRAGITHSTWEDVKPWP